MFFRGINTILLLVLIIIVIRLSVRINIVEDMYRLQTSVDSAMTNTIDGVITNQERFLKISHEQEAIYYNVMLIKKNLSSTNKRLVETKTLCAQCTTLGKVNP